MLYNGQLSFQQIADYVGISKRSIYRAFKKCLELGFITEKRRATELGIAYTQWGGGKTSLFRLHNLTFVIGIERVTRHLYERIEKIFKVKTWDLKNGVIPRQFLFSKVEQGDIWVRLMNKSLVLYMPEIVSESPEKAKDEVLEILKQVMPKIEQTLNIKLSTKPYMAIPIGSQHIALMNNEIAKAFLNAGIQFRIEDKDGAVRLIVDNSKQLEELEAIHRFYGEEDAQKIRDFMSDLVINNSYNSLKGDIKEIKQLLASMFEIKQEKQKMKYVG